MQVLYSTLPPRIPHHITLLLPYHLLNYYIWNSVGDLAVDKLIIIYLLSKTVMYRATAVRARNLVDTRHPRNVLRCHYTLR